MKKLIIWLLALAMVFVPTCKSKDKKSKEKEKAEQEEKEKQEGGKPRAGGTVYYIATNGNDANAGTITAPWKTFNKLSTVALVAGDIVYIRAGTYMSGRTSGGNGFNISNKSGASGNPITISAYPPDFPSGGRVVLDCRDYTGTASFYGANINNCPWFVWRGIKIIGVPQKVAGQLNPGWVMQGCSNTILDNCEAAYCGYSGFMLGASNNVTYNNCDAHGSDNPMDAGVQKHGGSDGFARTSADNTSTNTKYIGCRSWWNADDGWDCFNTNGTIYYENCWAFWNGYRVDVKPLSHCNGSDCWGDGNGFKMGGSGTNITSVTTRFVTNCLAFENYANGFDQNAGHFVGQLWNNTAWGQTGTSTSIGFAMAYYPLEGQPMVLRNNISYNNTYLIPSTPNTGAWVQSNNTWQSPLSGTVTNADFQSLNSTGADGPRQADGSLPNLTFLKLATGSNLIDAGINVGLPYNGSAPDVGAYETGGSGGGGTNSPPTVDAGGPFTITLPTNSVVMTPTYSDADGSVTNFLWTKVSGSGTISNPNIAAPTISGLTAGVSTYNLKVTDNLGATANDNVTISVNAAPVKPVANAGPDQNVNLPATSFSLNGSGSSDADGTIVSYKWTKVSGGAAVITTPNTVTTTVTGFAAGIYKFELLVTDNSALTARDTVQVTVSVVNLPPTVTAHSDTTIYLPANVAHLWSTANDPEGHALTYLWTKTSGPVAFTIATPTLAATDITGLDSGVYVFNVKVTDDSGAVANSSVTVEVKAKPQEFQWNIPQLHFEASQKAVKLLWTTEREKNLDYFFLEQSTDSLKWTDVIKVKANGNSTTLSAYEYSVNYPSKKTCVKKWLFFCVQYEVQYYPTHYYYRVRSVDTDSTVIHSNIVKS